MLRFHWLVFSGFLVCATMLSCSHEEDPPKRAGNVQWGEPFQGLSICFTIYGRDSFDYAPGEPVKLSADVKNISGQSLRIGNSEYATVHVRLPDGRELMLRALGDSHFHDKPPKSVLLSELAPGFSTAVVDHRILLSENSGALDVATGKLAEKVTFRTEGNYEFWAEYRVPKGNRESWSGTIFSPHVVLRVREVPLNKRVMKPTPQQLAALEKYYHHEGSRDIIEQSVEHTENEGLALYLLDEAEMRPSDRAGLLWFAELRSGGFSGLGIDGPYLKRYCEILLDELEGNEVKSASIGMGLPLEPLLRYLKFHKDDEAIKQRLLVIARRSANLALLPAGDLDIARGTPHSLGKNGPLYVGYAWAWRTLIDLGALHNGMTLNEATKVLGPPNENQGGLVSWYYPSGMHVIPTLIAQVNNDKLFGFQFVSR